MQDSRPQAPRYEPFGWHHWPDDFWMSYQFRRGLGETQEGGGAVSEVFQAGSRIVPGDFESWYTEWKRIADRNAARAAEAIQRKHVRTAMNCWLRAANYYREAEFWLAADDPRRLDAYTRAEEASRNCFTRMTPPAEVVEIPYEPGKPMPAYFIRSANGGPRQPVLISVGGLDSYKDELWFMTGRGAVQRGISVLLVDGPGQGGTLRRHKLPTRYDYEVPIGKCIDWLEKRPDVDPSRIAVSGSSLGGYYAARAASFEHRLAAAVSHGAIWSVNELWGEADDSHGLAGHIRWVFGVGSMQEAFEKGKDFTLDGVIDKIRCPYLIVHGGYDVLGVAQASKAYEYARKHGVDVTLDLVGEEETGAEHCQHDNPTLGQDRINDWLADRLGIDQRSLAC